MRNTLKVGSDFSGVGAFNQALKRLGVNYEELFACDMDKYSRKVFIHNYGTETDIEILKHPDVKFCDDIYYRLFIDLKSLRPTISEIKKLITIQEETARLFSFYYPWNVKYKKIPTEPLDIYMTSPPCQAFSLAGKRKGEDDKRGILFYNSHEFIKNNNPRYFIFENVKGLLSDNGGKTFARWVDYLGGKSVNGNPVIFPHEDSVPYHVYYKVLNAKNYGVPQNRERVFIIGIRDDADNNFSFPKEIHLIKRLKDVLEKNVDEKYFLSEKMLDGFTGIDVNGGAKTKRPGGRSSKSDKHNWDLIKVGYINQDTQASQIYSYEGIGQTLCAGTHGYANGYVKIEAIRDRNLDNLKSRKSGLETTQMLEINENGTSNCLTTVQKDNVVVEFNLPGKHEQNSRVYNINGVSPKLTTMQGGGQEPKILNDYRIRKLTPRECSRLMDFPDSFDFSCVSDSQAYKQAGNSIVVNVLCEVLIKLLKIKKPR
ncbi:DNA cytosine methyltransferase [Empedobacter brevis]